MDKKALRINRQRDLEVFSPRKKERKNPKILIIILKINFFVGEISFQVVESPNDSLKPSEVSPTTFGTAEVSGFSLVDAEFQLSFIYSESIYLVDKNNMTNTLENKIILPYRVVIF